MSDKYGFGGGITLPTPSKQSKQHKEKPKSLQAAVAAGEELGFVNREPRSVRLKPGPKRKEPQAKVSIPGPKRVIDHFRRYCLENDLSLWQGLESLLEKNDQSQ